MAEFSADNPVFVVFMLSGAVLLLKMIALSFCTSFYRRTKDAHVNPEDVTYRDPGGKKELKPVYNDADVERVRRAHRNDMENIYLFLFLGLFYVTTDPVVNTATRVFCAFTVARVLHSVVYVSGIRQPARGLCYMVGTLINIYMAVSIICHYITKLP